MEEQITNYRQLLAWQKAMELVELIFGVCRTLPDQQKFGLISQMQRAAISIPSIIAEGNAKRLGKDYVRHLKMLLDRWQDSKRKLSYVCGSILFHAKRTRNLDIVAGHCPTT